MQTHTMILPAGPHSRPVPTTTPFTRPGTVHAGSRGIWKDTRTKPLAA